MSSNGFTLCPKANTGAFIMAGMQDSKDYNRLVDKYGGGNLDLINNVCSYAPYIEELWQAGYSVCEPEGIYDYEVTTVFGAYIAGYIGLCGEFPSHESCITHLQNSVLEYFIAGRKMEDGTKRALKEVINAVPT